MKRLFYQTKLYDYTSIEEAEKHKEEMKQKGWYVRYQDDTKDNRPCYLYENGQDKYPYSIEYCKERY